MPTKKRPRRVCRAGGKYKQAIDDIRRVLERDPTDEKVLDWLAFSLYANGEYDEAITVYARLFEQHPENLLYSRWIERCWKKRRAGGGLRPGPAQGP